MIDSKEVVEQFLPQLEKSPKLQSGATRLLARLFHQEEVNDFIEQNKHMSHVDFLETVNQRLGLSYTVSNSSLENIPVSGRVVIIANHPLGSLDGLALLVEAAQMRLIGRQQIGNEEDLRLGNKRAGKPGRLINEL